MNPLSLIPPRWRLTIYLTFAVANVILGYTSAKGWTDQAESTLINGLGVALGLTAASNVDLAPPEPPNRNAD